jgi:DNA-binding NtrC family response regulator
LEESAENALRSHWWNGNIRELQNCIEKAVILSDGVSLKAKDLQLEPVKQASPSSGTLRAISEAEEERLIRNAMERSNGNISSAAKMLGVSRPTLYAKLKKYGL